MNIDNTGMGNLETSMMADCVNWKLSLHPFDWFVLRLFRLTGIYKKGYEDGWNSAMTLTLPTASTPAPSKRKSSKAVPISKQKKKIPSPPPPPPPMRVVVEGVGTGKKYGNAIVMDKKEMKLPACPWTSDSENQRPYTPR